MSGGPTRRLLPDGRRLHLQHGPIDLVIEAWGPPGEISTAYGQAWERFQDILPGLVAELPLLRRALDETHPGVTGPVARRMLQACRPHAGDFITPMAAVAGSVADEVLAALVAGRTLARAYVNNGGDIALHLAAGERLAVGLVGDQRRAAIEGVAAIESTMPVRGVATSGRGGRSFSLGIAEAATVLAANAAEADAAATLVANAVDLDHPAIRRAPALSLDPDSDLGERLVTTGVGALAAAEIDAALAKGATVAERMRRDGLIAGAMILLQSRYRAIGEVVERLASAA